MDESKSQRVSRRIGVARARLNFERMPAGRGAAGRSSVDQYPCGEQGGDSYLHGTLAESTIRPRWGIPFVENSSDRSTRAGPVTVACRVLRFSTGVLQVEAQTAPDRAASASRSGPAVCLPLSAGPYRRALSHPGAGRLRGARPCQLQRRCLGIHVTNGLGQVPVQPLTRDYQIPVKPGDNTLRPGMPGLTGQHSQLLHQSAVIVETPGSRASIPRRREPTRCRPRHP